MTSHQPSLFTTSNKQRCMAQREDKRCTKWEGHKSKHEVWCFAGGFKIVRWAS